MGASSEHGEGISPVASGFSGGAPASRYRTATSRIRALEAGAAELLEGVSDGRVRELAQFRQFIEAIRAERKEQELPQHMQKLATQLQTDREDRARMETGVEYAVEGAQLPPLSGDECH